MSSDISVLVAQAVVAELQAGVDADTFPLPFTPRRMYDTTVELEDQALHVDVVAGYVESEMGTRSELENHVNIDIAVRQQVDKSNTVAVDTLMELRDQIKQFFLPVVAGQGPRPLSTYQNAAFEKVVTRAPFYPDQLRTFGQFTAILTFTYLVWQ